MTNGKGRGVICCLLEVNKFFFIFSSVSAFDYNRYRSSTEKRKWQREDSRGFMPHISLIFAVCCPSETLSFISLSN